MQRARCVHPAALLTSMRVAQSRFEEADPLPSQASRTCPRWRSRGPRCSLHAANPQLPWPSCIGASTSWAGTTCSPPRCSCALVEAEIAHADLTAAADAANHLDALAEGSERERDRADAALALGRVTAATGGDPRADLERALEIYGRLEMPLQAAQARVEIARSVRATEPALAIEEARVALSAFDRIGAVRDADIAANLLRELGATGRAGPKGLERLTKREREILALLGQGLTNAEIAARLFISTKTASHHVSNILAKLGVRNRSEAGAYAHRYLSNAK